MDKPNSYVTVHLNSFLDIGENIVHKRTTLLIVLLILLEACSQESQQYTSQTKASEKQVSPKPTCEVIFNTPEEGCNYNYLYCNHSNHLTPSNMFDNGDSTLIRLRADKKGTPAIYISSNREDNVEDLEYVRTNSPPSRHQDRIDIIIDGVYDVFVIHDDEARVEVMKERTKTSLSHNIKYIYLKWPI